MNYVRGALPSQELRELIKQGLFGEPYTPEVENNIQPASYDPLFEEYCYRVPHGFKPIIGITVEEALRRLPKKDLKRYDLSKGLEVKPGFNWLIPLRGTYSIPEEMWLKSSPKSTQGRLANFLRLVADNTPEYDEVWGPFKGKLYALLEPRIFSIIIYSNIPLLQLRAYKGTTTPYLTTEELSREITKHSLILLNGAPLDTTTTKLLHGVPLTVDLKGEYTNGLVGYKARPSPDPIDLSKPRSYDIEDYFDQVLAPADGTLKIYPSDKLYLLASRELVRVPPHLGASLAEYHPQHGELRFHKAGFFDPGFGHGENGEHPGASAVLEVHSKEGGIFNLGHGEGASKLIFEWLTSIPDKIYGETINSTYTKQFGPWYAKPFKLPQTLLRQQGQELPRTILCISRTLLAKHYHQGFKIADDYATNILTSAVPLPPQESTTSTTMKQLSTMTVIYHPATKSIHLTKTILPSGKRHLSILTTGYLDEEDLLHDQPYKNNAKKALLKNYIHPLITELSLLGTINNDDVEDCKNTYSCLLVAETTTNNLNTSNKSRMGTFITLEELQLLSNDRNNQLDHWSRIALHAVKHLLMN